MIGNIALRCVRSLSDTGMRHFFFLSLLVLCSVSCARKEQSVVVPSRPVAQFIISDKTYQLTARESANENCNFIFFSFNMYRNSPQWAVKGFPYSAEFQFTKDGQLLFARLESDTAAFRTSTFAPMRSVSIRNFAYDPTQKELSLDADITLLNTRTLRPVVLKTVVDRLFIQQTNCSDSHTNTFSASLERIGVGTTLFQSRINGGETNNLFVQPPYPTPTYYRHTLVSTNGYEIRLENSVGLKPLKKGVYAVSSEMTTPLKVSFNEFLGETTAASFDSYLSKEWRAYQVSGTLEITEEYATAGKVKGKLNLTASRPDGKPVFRLQNGAFVVYNPLR